MHALIGAALGPGSPDPLYTMGKTFADTPLSTGADPAYKAEDGHVSHGRVNQRNDYGPRAWDTRAHRV